MAPVALARIVLTLIVAIAACPASALTIVVNDSSDTLHSCATTATGTCSLRDAILFANIGGGSDTINFNIGGGGSQTITPLSPLPAITATVTIDGYSQPGATANTLAVGNNANLLIELDGSSAGLANGITVLNAPGSVIKGLVINRFALAGIQVAPTVDTFTVTIQGNFIGTDAAGTLARANGGNGIEFVNSHAAFGTIGGIGPAIRNVISGNGLDGIFLAGNGNTVQGNYIGTNAGGTAALANAYSGVDIAANNSQIGGNPTFGQRNVISGNGFHGISIASATASGNIINGNFIGTDATGTSKLGNTLDGIFTNGPSTMINLSSNVIGGNLGNGINVGGSADGTVITPAQIIGTDLGRTLNLGNGSVATHAGINISGNASVQIDNATIAFNAGPGIRISNNAATAVIVTGGSFFGNGGRAIDLTDGPPPINDPCDPDIGNNDLQNYPVLNSATITGGTVKIDVTFNSSPGVTHTLEFFSSPVCDPSGFGEGKTSLGSGSAVPGPSPGCSTSFTTNSLLIPPGESVITAYARGPTGKTSEFSQCIVATGPAAPVLASVASRKVHGAAGTFDLPLVLTPTNPTTEPRLGPAHTIVFTFDKPVTSGNASVSEGVATVGAPTFSGNEMRVALSGVTNAQYVTLNASNVASSDGGTGGAGSARIGLLQGDVNQNRVVSVADLGLVNAVLAQVVTAGNFLRDVNATGTLTVADKGLTNAVLTTALPAP